VKIPDACYPRPREMTNGARRDVNLSVRFFKQERHRDARLSECSFFVHIWRTFHLSAAFAVRIPVRHAFNKERLTKPRAQTNIFSVSVSFGRCSSDPQASLTHCRRTIYNYSLLPIYSLKRYYTHAVALITALLCFFNERNLVLRARVRLGKQRVLHDSWISEHKRMHATKLSHPQHSLSFLNCRQKRQESL